MTLQRVEQADAITRLLSEHPCPSSVLVTDEGLSDDQNAYLEEPVLQFVTEGGTAVPMGRFSSFTELGAVESFFATAGLQ